MVVISWLGISLLQEMLVDNNAEGRDLNKPFLPKGRWYHHRIISYHCQQAIANTSFALLACVLVVALGPIQFGFTVNIYLLIKKLNILYTYMVDELLVL